MKKKPNIRVIAIWGATYPVAYEFDSFGRMTAMATTRDDTSDFSTLAVQLAAGQSIMSIGSTWSLDKTQWLYDQPTGLLTNKLYSDNKGPTYTYTADGKLATRTWARGVVTSYGYDFAGSLTHVAYSDGTPGVTNTVDRLGRLVTITDAQGTRTNVYSASTLALIEEHLPDGTILTRTHDIFGRASGLTVAGVGDPGDPPYAIAYGHDSLGRFSTVTSVIENATNTFTYAYVPGADLIASASNNLGQVAARSYETHRDLITSIENTWGTNLISRFDYTNDELARRTRRVDNGSVTNDFGYNLRSEVIEALMGTNTYGYAYDPIGNLMHRITPSNDGGASTNYFAANELNQYTNIANGVTLEPVFDDDGNMIAYGDWAFTWNGENRIIAASNAAHVVLYSYDHVGRMFAKTTFETSDLGTPISDLRHIWDGFNIVRSATMSNDVVIAAEYNVWGLDLSQTLQGAGGVGGLLATVRSGDPELVEGFPALDANGNITEYVDATGAIVAHREYSPFGETTVLSGSMQNAFTHWWSTKPWDPITGFSEYEFRMYSPELGRWLNRDPIEEQGGVNLYVMCSNDILQGTDLLGLCDAYDETDKRCSTDLAIAFLPGLSNKALVIRYSFIFRSACQEHDRCYATCGKSKRECDDVFGREMDDICRKRYPRPFIHAAHRVECLAMSKTFLGAVRLFGDTPAAGSQRFSKLQEMAREKCCCDQSSDHLME